MKCKKYILYRLVENAAHGTIVSKQPFSINSFKDEIDIERLKDTMNAGPAPAEGEKYNACCVLLRHRGPVPTEGERSNEADSNLCLDWNQYCYFPAGDVAGWFDEQGRRHEVRGPIYPLRQARTVVPADHIHVSSFRLHPPALQHVFSVQSRTGSGEVLRDPAFSGSVSDFRTCGKSVELL